LRIPLAHILYIDDDDGIRRLVSRALTRKGFDVSLAASGREGVAMAADVTFDLIAVDHYMPGQDGLMTLQVLRERPDCPPIVYVTGSEESRIAVAALKSGAEDYVVKSVGEEFFELLLSSIDQLLDRAQLRRAREQAETELRLSNMRLEALLKEVNHRVANNLQMVMSFIALQSRNLEDAGAKECLRQTRERIAAIAQVNRRLYTSDDVEFVAMDEYLAALAIDLTESWSTSHARRDVRVDADGSMICTDQAVALGMIANEWISNACKYAYGADEHGEIRVTLRQAAPDAIELAVEDDGIGLPADGAIRGTGLGTRLIEALAKTHRASLDYGVAGEGHGTRAAIRLPLRPRDQKLG